MKTQYLSGQEIYDGAVRYLFDQGGATILPYSGTAHRGQGGRCCPIGSPIGVRDYTTSMENVPMRYVSKSINEVPYYVDAGVVTLRHALKHARIDADDRDTVELFSRLRDAYDVFDTWERKEHLQPIARRFDLNSTLVNTF